VNIILSKSRFGNENQSMHTLKVTIPENLDYEGLFDDLFEKYSYSAEIDRVKTTNMGSLYEISYLVQLKTAAAPKEFLDELRCRNGNLNIICGSRDRGYSARTGKWRQGGRTGWRRNGSRAVQTGIPQNAAGE